MKIDRTKLELKMAEVLMNPKEVSDKAGISYPAFRRAIREGNSKIATIGRIAKALNVDPAEIIKQED